MADKVKISQDAFQKAITELQTAKGLLENDKAEMSKKYSSMRADWKGLAGEAFESQSQIIIKQFEVNIENLGKHIKSLQFVAQSMAEVDQQLAQRIDGGGTNTLHLRSAFESQGYTVDWAAGATTGNSTITLTSASGEMQTLKEGVDYYIGTDGKAYFYNNVRAILEANGATVDFAKTPGGGSTIMVSTPTAAGGTEVTALTEGKDYYIGKDGKAHFLDTDTYGPLPPVVAPAKSNGTQDSDKGIAPLIPNTIRYISQISSSTEYNSEYWGDYSPAAGCAVSCVSMALSSLGINLLPKQVCNNNLKAKGNNNPVYMYWGNSGDFTWTSGISSLDSCLQNYADDPSKYAPPIMKLPNKQHYVVVTGKNDNGSYNILDPANAKNTVWTGSSTPQVIQYNK